jgi:vitamin B12 transporter
VELHGDLWQARLEAIYQDPRDLADDSRLLRRTRESLTAALTRAFGPVQLGSTCWPVATARIWLPHRLTLDGYVLANSTAQWRATHSFALVARVENLFNEQYELVDNYNSAGRGVYFTVRYAPPTSGSRGQ